MSITALTTIGSLSLALICVAAAPRFPQLFPPITHHSPPPRAVLVPLLPSDPSLPQDDPDSLLNALNRLALRLYTNAWLLLLVTLASSTRLAVYLAARANHWRCVPLANSNVCTICLSLYFVTLRFNIFYTYLICQTKLIIFHSIILRNYLWCDIIELQWMWHGNLFLPLSLSRYSLFLSDSFAASNLSIGRI